jgi:uncharacterized membrane protein
MFVCLYFLQGASELLDENKSIIKFMKVFIVISVLVFASMIVYMWYTSTNNIQKLCNTPYFITPDVVNQIINVIFVAQAF